MHAAPFMKKVKCFTRDHDEARSPSPLSLCLRRPPFFADNAFPFTLNEDANKTRFALVDEGVLRPATQAGAGPSRGPSRAGGREAGSGTAGSERDGAGSGAGDSARRTVVVITENRAREVGIASCDLGALHRIELAQISDNQSYTQTSVLLGLLRPAEIIFSRSQAERVLTRKVLEDWGIDTNPDGAEVKLIGRAYFDEVRGRAAARALSASGEGGADGDGDGADKYLAFASLAALLKYIESLQHITFAPASVHFVWRAGRGKMSIDFESVRNLELLQGTRPGSTPLFSVINHTRTKVGARLLRSSLLAPCSEAGTLSLRLDAVDDILRNEGVYMALTRDLLPKLLDTDHLLSQFAYVPKVHTPRTARGAIAAVIALKHTVELVSDEMGGGEVGESGRLTRPRFPSSLLLLLLFPLPPVSSPSRFYCCRPRSSPRRSRPSRTTAFSP